jgi:tetraacyldisaccharide 4'-kinase
MNSFASLILPPLSTIYSVATRARLTAYRRGWFSVSKLAAPVISVGNLTTGGTGKTPFVEWVCRLIAAGGGDAATDGRARQIDQGKKRVCVLTRGYGRTNPGSQVVVSNGSELLANVKESGDEPYVLANNLIGIAAVISNPNRFAAGQWAIENLSSEVFVLDDGFQHLRLARDLDIVTIDATNPWGGGSLLPYGRLREPRAGLSRADCVVITRTEQVEDLAPVKDAVQRLVGTKPIFLSRMATSGVRSLDGRSIHKESLLSQPLAAFCGVGNPESFFSHLRHEGYLPVFTRAFADHHDYNQSDIDRLVQDAKAHGTKALLTTAKDAIKLSALQLELPCHILDIHISIDEKERLVEMILNACRKSQAAVT